MPLYRQPVLNVERNSEFTSGKNSTVRIALKVWNKLALESQTGLLVHETFRQIQLDYGFNDELLQKATAILLMCEPSVRLDQYVQAAILNRIEHLPKDMREFETLTVTCGGSR